MLAPIANLSATVNELIEIAITATDANSSDTLSFSLDPDNSPETATLEQTGPGTAIIRWIPTPFESGQQTPFRVVVTDDGEPPLEDVEEFLVDVSVSAPVSLVDFAQALSDANAQFLGAAFDEQSTAQRELFEEGGQLLPFTDITNSDRSLNSTAVANGITSPDQPVWIFANGERLDGVQSLQRISQVSGVLIPAADTPFIAEIPTETLLIGSPLHVPLDGYDPDGGPLSYTFTTDNPGVTAELITDNRSLRLDVEGYGDLVFELFEQRANVATDRVITLAESGFYDGTILHRVLDDFVIQGGDPNGDGTGGSDLPDFDDQFNVDLQHNRTGLLSFAKGADDTNNSQFFITEGSSPGLRNLDFNHTVFGILTEGELTRAAISEVSVEQQSFFNAEVSRPLFDVTVNSATVFEDTENATVLLRAAEGTTGPVNVTVTATDQQGNTFDRIFTVNVQQDNDTLGSGTNGRPFFVNEALEALVPDTIPAGTTTPIQLTEDLAIDVEGDPFVFTAVQSGPVNFGLAVDDDGLVLITPPAGFTGDLEVEFRVQREIQIAATDFDAQTVRISVTQPVDFVAPPVDFFAPLP